MTYTIYRRSPAIRDALRPVGRGGLVLRCEKCSAVLHDQCRGRATGCRCSQCWTREMLRNARSAYTTPGVLSSAWYRALGDLLALESQRSARRRKIRTAAPQFNSYCEAPRCGKPVMGSPYGRKRRYCSPSCKARAYRQRRQEVSR
jgi:hypothetical protein